MTRSCSGLLSLVHSTVFCGLRSLRPHRLSRTYLPPYHSATCLFRLTCQVHPTLSGPFFVFQDVGFLTRPHVASVLAVVFSKQFKPKYPFVPYRGCFSTSRWGVSEYIIQSMGRWSSDSFLRYLRLPHPSLRVYQMQMS